MIFTFQIYFIGYLFFLIILLNITADGGKQLGHFASGG